VFVNAQIKTVSFKDGTEIEYEILENNCDNAVRGAVKICFGSAGLSYEYVNPKLFMVEVGVGDGIYGHGIIAFAKKDKEKESRVALRSISTGANSTTNYVIDGVKRIRSSFFGIHAGAKKFFEVFWPHHGVAIYGGLGHYTTEHLKYFVKEKASGKSNKVNSTVRRGVFIDYYFLPNYSSSESVYDPVAKYSSEVRTVSKKNGIGITWQSTSFKSMKGKKGFGGCYSLGIGKIFGTEKGSGGYIYSFGIGLAF